MRIVGLVFVVAVAGCASLKGRGDDLYGQGKYAEAAEVYDEALAHDPGDKDLITKRTAARNAAIRVVLQDAWKARRAGQMEAATTKVDELLARKDAWKIQFEPEIVEAATAEITAVGTYAQSLVTNAARMRGPLVGHGVMTHYQPLFDHPDMRTWAKNSFDAVAEAGRDACARLAPTATTPYWTWVLNRYCRRVANQTLVVPKLPYLRQGLDVRGSVSGATTGEQTQIQAAIANGFRSSVWFAGDGEAPIAAQVSGAVSSSFDANPASKTVEYTVEIPYTAYEDEQVAYQEPYDDTEGYTEQVPETTYDTESYACGDSTCTRSVPRTTYRSEYRTRTVTKYRTAYRTEQRAVTKYRTEYRTFDYDVVERTGRYQSQLRVALGPELDRVVAEIGGAFEESGVDHDVTFTPAGITPSRANLPTPEEFIAHEETRLANELTKKLDAQYAARFCSLTTFSLEDAAACAYLDASTVPYTAQQALVARLGADAALLGPLLARR